MKRLMAMVTLVTSLALVSPQAFAATATTGALSISAQVDSTLTLSVILRQNSSTGTVISAMNFGTLQELVQTSGARSLRSSTAGSTGTGNVTAMITANSHGLPYVIRQTGTALSNGVTTLPTGACTVVPVYAIDDNNGQSRPAGSLMGIAGSWVSVDKTLYASESGTAQVRTIQAIYSITDDPTAGATAAVPISQAGGTYNGTVTITVTA